MSAPSADAAIAHRRRRDITGAALLVFAWVFFTTEMISVRLLSDELSTVQMAAIRTGAQAFLMLGLLAFVGKSVVTTKRLPLHVLRAFFAQSGMAAYYLAFALLPLALATTLTFTQASFVTVFAAIFLGETIGWRRITAVIVGFLGVLIVMRPGLGGYDPAMLVALFGAAVSAGLITVTRSLSVSDGRWTVMFYSSWFGLAMIAIPAVILWRPVEAEHLPLLCLLSVSGMMGQFFMVGAFQLAEASVLAPVDYVRLVFAVAGGYVLFSEVPDFWVFLGSAVVLASAATIAMRRPHHATSSSQSA